jgi:class 3 adenylate cyclase
MLTFVTFASYLLLVRSLPVGTVTLVFTDIEGSTRLLRKLGDDYADLLAEHNRLLRKAFVRHRGVEVDTQGDAFFVAFQRAQDAVAAAVEAQHALGVHLWPESAEPRVRMAIHTGEPAPVGEERFIGLAVHRAARICSVAHGGQVLLSATTRDLVEDDLPPGVALLDLGEHHLKDLDRPERIAQLVIEGIPPVFTPLDTVAAQPVTMPFAGQEGQLAVAARAAIAEVLPVEPPVRVRWSVAGRARAHDWRQFIHVPGRSRLANRIEGLGFSIHATWRIGARDDLQAELRTLGRTLVTIGRDARSAETMLRSEDVRVLRRELASYRANAHLSDRLLRAADATATEIAELEVLAKRHREFEEEARRLEPRVRAIRARVFDARLDVAILENLMRELRPLRESAEALSATLHEACDRALRASAEATRLRHRGR